MSEQTVDRCISLLRSYLRRDQVKMSDTLHDDTGVLRGDYELVREFDVPCGCLTILEALVVANSISDVSPRYTVLTHTCQFWAINLFLTLRTIVTRRELRVPEQRTGSQLLHGGRVHGVLFSDMDSGNATAAFISQISETLRRRYNSTIKNQNSIGQALAGLFSDELASGKRVIAHAAKER
ncbi:hypothetical protein BKA62DRAFT_818108 [Auriculariales sp. MPI-PUGE-AT-0066]|nr:hypothetical protein BKA62DRAFT_818108 [Auriculariales sp. MPI-PUGE-AT-0066]